MWFARARLVGTVVVAASIFGPAPAGGGGLSLDNDSFDGSAELIASEFGSALSDLEKAAPARGLGR